MRELEISSVLRAVDKGHHAVLKGRSGIGKTTLLELVAVTIIESSDRLVLRLQPISIRQALIQVSKQLHNSVGLKLTSSSLPPKVASRARMGQKLSWDDIRKSVSRFTVDEALTTILRTIENRRCVLIVDSLEVPPTYFDALEKLMQHAQIIAAMDSDNRRNRAVKLVSGFPTTIELRPLPLDASEKLIRDYLNSNPLRFTDHKSESLFVRKVGQEGRGVPGAIVSLLESAAGEDRITPAKVRLMQSDAAVQYLDMTPALVIILAGVMALRYIGKGIGETELIVISGVGTSLFIVIRFLFFAMRRR